MNISQENIDAVNAVVTIDFTKADYEEKWADALKKYRKRVAMPGFRPGQAPAAMIKRMYGKAILADVINELVGKTINDYIKEKDLHTFGEPLPSESMEPIDFDKDDIDNIQFKFDLGLKPEINIEINESIKLPYYNIEVTDEQVEETKKAYSKNLQKMEPVDVAGEASLITGSLVQEGGFKAENTIVALAHFKDEETKAMFIGKEEGDSVTFDIRKAYGDDSAYVAYALNISHDEADKAQGDYTFTINKVMEYKEPEHNQDFFDTVFGKDVVKSEEEFTAKVKEDVVEGNKAASNVQFLDDARKALMGMVDPQMPEAFLKRWILLVNRDNKEATPEVVEKEFPQFIEEMKWNEISNSIAIKNDLKVSPEELLEAAKKSVLAQFRSYGFGANIDDATLTSMASKAVSDKNQYEAIARRAANEKTAEFIKSKASIDEKKVSMSEFDNIRYGQASK